MTTPLSMVNALVPADAVNFDNLISFTSAQPIQVTAHPVEFGVDVSDHAQRMPNELIFSVQVTKSPLGIPDATTVESATAWFERNTGKAINITAPAGIFSNYVITRWDYPQQPGQRVFNVTAREVRFEIQTLVGKNSPLVSSEYDAKIPIASLEPDEECELSAVVTTGTGIEFTARLGWIDSDGSERRHETLLAV